MVFFKTPKRSGRRRSFSIASRGHRVSWHLCSKASLHYKYPTPKRGKGLRPGYLHRVSPAWSCCLGAGGAPPHSTSLELPQRQVQGLLHHSFWHRLLGLGCAGPTGKRDQVRKVSTECPGNKSLISQSIARGEAGLLLEVLHGVSAHCCLGMCRITGLCGVGAPFVTRLQCNCIEAVRNKNCINTFQVSNECFN